MILKVFRRSLFQFLVWILLMLVLMTPLIWLKIVHPNHLQNLVGIISQNKSIFIAIRWLMIIVLFCAWPHVIRWRAKRQYWKPEKTMFWLNQRVKIAFWLVIFELIVCENLFLVLLHMWEGR